MDKILLALFGKFYFKLKGKIEIREQRYFKQLDIIVTLNSIDELETQIEATKTERAKALDPDTEHTLAEKVDDLQNDLTSKNLKLEEHKLMLQNLEYKGKLLSQL